MAKESPQDKLNTRLDRLEEAGMERTQSWAAMWQENLRYIFSDQLAGKLPHKGWEWIIVNYIWPSIIAEIAKLSKNHPRIIANPWDDGDTDAAETWQAHLQWQWEQGINEHGMRLEQIRALFDGKLFGYRVSKIFWESMSDWDDQKKRYLGNVKHKLWHPAYFWADADEYIDDGNCGTVRYVELEWAKARWPRYAKRFDEEADKHDGAQLGAYGGDHIRGQLASPGLTSGKGGVDKGEVDDHPNRLLSLILEQDRLSQTNNEQAAKADKKFVKVSEIWLNDYETVHQKIEEDIPAEELIQTGVIAADPLTGLLQDAEGRPFPDKPQNWPRRVVDEWDEPKYPNGRYVLRVNHIILNPDYEEQRWPYRRWPFVVTPHYLLPHMWQGSDAVQMYKTTQDMINVTASYLTNHMKCHGAPRTFVEDGAIPTDPKTRKPYRILAAAGSIIRVVRGALSKNRKIVVDPPAPMSQSLPFMYNLMAQEFKNLSGLQDIAQGIKQPGEMSATESQWLALSANDRIALQSAMEDVWVREVCSLIAAACQKNYTIERLIRIVGEDKIIGATQITQGLKDVRFDVEILPATTLPYDEDKRLEKHLKAYEILLQPVVNPMLPTILRGLEVPNWKKMLEQHEPWMLWVQFLQLYEAVRSGQIMPEQGIQILVQAARQRFMQGQNTPEMIEGRNKEKEKLDKEKEKWKKEEQQKKKKKEKK